MGEVQAHLSPHQVLIEYHQGKKYIFSIFVNRDTVDMRMFAKDSLMKLINPFLAGLHGKQTLEAEVAHTLFKLLIESFHIPLRQELIIIPDGILSYLPFEALLSKAPSKQAQAQLGASFWKGTRYIEGQLQEEAAHYLLFDQELRYAHSASLLFGSYARKPRSYRMAIFAPQYDSLDVFNHQKILPLETRSHAQQLRDAFICDSYIEEASSAIFTQKAPSYSLIHFAAHGFVDSDNPLKASIAFHDDTQPSDMLTVAELYASYPIKSELVSLLSCNTGLGKYAPGEGVMSIARAFRYQGAQSVVMSLWEADVSSGTELFERFYRFLHEGKNKGQALREAKIKYLKNATTIEAHPSKWANFVFVGNNQPITLAASQRGKWIILIASLTVLGIAFGLWRHSNKQ